MADFNFKDIWAKFRQQLAIELKYAKLTAVEKLAILLSGIALVAVALILGIGILLAVAMALYFVFNGITGQPWCSCLIVAGVFVLLLVLTLVFRKPLILNPITRFVTKLFLTPSDDE